MMKKNYLRAVVLGAFMLVFAACGSLKPPDLSTLKAPEPIPDNSGKYMCPYTSDGVLAEWVDKAMYAGAAKDIGGAVGSYVGEKAAEQVLGNIPFVGGYVGQKAGEALGRTIAIQAAGGWDFIKSKSDLSFNRPEDLAVWMYVNHGKDENYPEVLKIVMGIYPELEKNYQDYLYNAARGR